MTSLFLNKWTFFDCFCVSQVIRGAGHYVFADQPDDFNQAVLEILARMAKECNTDKIESQDSVYMNDTGEGLV